MQFKIKDKVFVQGHEKDIAYDSFNGLCLENANNEEDTLVEVIDLETKDILSVFSSSLRLPIEL